MMEPMRTWWNRGWHVIERMMTWWNRTLHLGNCSWHVKERIMPCWNRWRNAKEQATTEKNLRMSELHIFIHNPIDLFIVCLGSGLCFVLSAVPHPLSSGRLYIVIEEEGCSRRRGALVRRNGSWYEGTDDDMWWNRSLQVGTEPSMLRNRSCHVGTGADISRNRWWHVKERA